jgi:hypothetical protein
VLNFPRKLLSLTADPDQYPTDPIVTVNENALVKNEKGLLGHPHYSSPSSVQLSAAQRSNARSLLFLSLSLTPVSAPSAKPSTLPVSSQPSQAKVLTGGGDLRKAQVDVPVC